MKIKMMNKIDDGPSWFYVNGHGVDRAPFLQAVVEKVRIEYGDWLDGAPTADDIQEVWFQRMSPSEARANGIDWGVWMRTEPEHGAYPVTLVEA